MFQDTMRTILLLKVEEFIVDGVAEPAAAGDNLRDL